MLNRTRVDICPHQDTSAFWMLFRWPKGVLGGLPYLPDSVGKAPSQAGLGLGRPGPSMEQSTESDPDPQCDPFRKRKVAWNDG